MAADLPPFINPLFQAILQWDSQNLEPDIVSDLVTPKNNWTRDFVLRFSVQIWPNCFEVKEI